MHTTPPGSGPAPGAPESLPVPGERVGPCLVVRELARGGMGAVYVARDELGRELALKVMLSEGVDERFALEAQATARLGHPAIVRVYSAGRDARGRAYLVMDLVPGESLQDRLRAGGPLDEEQAARLTLTLAEALHHAHAHGVLHRDLKPHNVLLTPAGQPVLTDFGLARVSDQSQHLTQTGEVLGTPAYMPPEQASGEREQVGPASDVYGLGATLYAMLSGEAPFHSSSPVSLLFAVLSKPPAPLPPEVDPALAAVVARCLEKDPARRYPSMEALGRDLQRFLAGELEAPARRRPALALLALLALLAGLVLLVAVAGLGWALTRESPQQAAGDAPPGAEEEAPADAGGEVLVAELEEPLPTVVQLLAAEGGRQVCAGYLDEETVLVVSDGSEPRRLRVELRDLRGEPQVVVSLPEQVPEDAFLERLALDPSTRGRAAFSCKLGEGDDAYGAGYVLLRGLLSDDPRAEWVELPGARVTKRAMPLAFAPGQDLLAVGLADLEVRLVAPGEGQGHALVHPGDPEAGADELDGVITVSTLAFSPDGETLATAATLAKSGEVYLWDTSDLASPPEDPRASVPYPFASRLLPLDGGRHLIVAGYGGTLARFVREGELLDNAGDLGARSFGSPIRALALRGTTLFVGSTPESDDEAAPGRLWAVDLERPLEDADLPREWGAGAAEPASRLDLSPSGHRLLVSHDDGSVVSYAFPVEPPPARAWEEAASLLPPGSERRVTTWARFLDERAALVVARPGRDAPVVTLHDVDAPQRSAREVPLEGLPRLGVQPEGLYLDPRSPGRAAVPCKEHQPRPAPGDRPPGLAGYLLLEGLRGPLPTARYVPLQDLADRATGDGTLPLAFDPQRPVLALGLSRRRLALVDLDSGRVRALLQHPAPAPAEEDCWLSAVGFSPAGDLLATGSGLPGVRSEGSVCLWRTAQVEAPDAEPLATFGDLIYTRQLLFLDDDVLYYGAQAGGVGRLGRLEGGWEELDPLTLAEAPRSRERRPVQDLLHAHGVVYGVQEGGANNPGGSQGRVWALDTAAGTPAPLPPALARDADRPATSVHVSPSGELLLVAFKDGEVRVYERE